MLKSILKELRELKKHGITEDELVRAKDHLKGGLMLGLESTSSRMNRLAKHEMHFGTFLSMDAMLGAIAGVRLEEVQALLGQSWTRSTSPSPPSVRSTAATSRASCWMRSGWPCATLGPPRAGTPATCSRGGRPRRRPLDAFCAGVLV